MDNWWAKDDLEEDSEEEEEEEESYEDNVNECNPFMALDTDPN